MTAIYVHHNFSSFPNITIYVYIALRVRAGSPGRQCMSGGSEKCAQVGQLVSSLKYLTGREVSDPLSENTTYENSEIRGAKVLPSRYSVYSASSAFASKCGERGPNEIGQDPDNYTDKQ